MRVYSDRTARNIAFGTNRHAVGVRHNEAAGLVTSPQHVPVDQVAHGPGRALGTAKLLAAVLLAGWQQQLRDLDPDAMPMPHDLLQIIDGSPLLMSVVLVDATNSHRPPHHATQPLRHDQTNNPAT